MTGGWRFRFVDALDKVFPDETPAAVGRGPLTVLAGEPAALQLAVLPPEGIDRGHDALRVEVEGVDAALHSVELVPCLLVAYPGHDAGYVRDSPGLYPDLLIPVGDGIVEPFVGAWRAIWIDLLPAAAGPYRVRVRVRHAARGDVLFDESLDLEVLDAELPALDIVNSNWLHADALADAYGDEVFGEHHWSAIDAFVASAARMRVNSLLVPVWTPPIDTEPGRRRRPAQLLDVRRDGGAYAFGFAQVDRWLGILRRHGIAHLEVPHLFTQWGAAAAPAIDAVVDGRLEQIFGWDTPSTDPEYRRFLEHMIPALRRHLDGAWPRGEVVFHVSDEPEPAHAAGYRAARGVVADLLAGAQVRDAVSDPAYLESGLIELPIAATDSVEPFLAAGVDDLWVYFCVTQNRDVANRFIGMPSARQRIIGPQVFAAGVRGLLHWGFNFYYSSRARRFVDPFTDTSAGGTLLAGDPFAVYPGPGRRPWESIRHRVAAQAMDDHRALQFVRDTGGPEVALAALDGQARSFRAPDVATRDIRSMRDRIHAAIRSATD
jgi:hypothetical protein